MTDTRPAECRERLHDEGKPYPRSNCESCGSKVRFRGPCPYTVTSESEWTTWNGGGNAPYDWDRGAVLLRDGTLLTPERSGWCSPSGDCFTELIWIHNGGGLDIIGYNRKHAPAAIDHVAALLAQGWTKRDDGTLVPPDSLADIRKMLAEFARDVSAHGLAKDIARGACDTAVRAFQDALALKRPID